MKACACQSELYSNSVYFKDFEAVQLVPCATQE